MESDFYEKYIFLLLFASGLVALIPTESKAQVTISVGPGCSHRGYYYQNQPYYYRGQAHKYYSYRHNERYYRWHQHNGY